MNSTADNRESLLPESFLNSPAYVNPELRAVAMHLVDNAARHSEWRTAFAGRGNVNVLCEPGAVVTNRRAIGAAISQPASSVGWRLAKLVEYGFCTVRTETHYTVVRINGWPLFANYIGA